MWGHCVMKGDVDEGFGRVAHTIKLTDDAIAPCLSSVFSPALPLSSSSLNYSKARL